MASNRGIYNDGWYANTTPPVPPWELKAATLPIEQYKWELYNLKEDYSQFNDLSAKMPAKLKEMQAVFAQEAKKYNVYPLDNQAFARAITPRPSTVAGKTDFTYTGVNIGIPTGNAPNILNRSFKITAEVDVPQGGGDGMIVTEGGRWAGYGLVHSQRQACVLHTTCLELLVARWANDGDAPLAPGKHTIVFDFTYDGPGIAKGGTGVLTRGRPRGAEAVNSENDSVPDTARREFRHRGGHAHGGERSGLPGAVQLRRQDRQADVPSRTDPADPGGTEDD